MLRHKTAGLRKAVLTPGRLGKLISTAHTVISLCS